MKPFRILCCFLILTLARPNAYVPKIAIVANFDPENSEDPEKAFISASYVRWIEDVGGQVLPILPWYSQEKVNEILSKTNGVLWLGGSRDLNLTGKFEVLNRYVLDRLIEYNENGTHYPLFVICQGLEMLHSIIANTTAVLTNYDAYDYMLPIDIDKEKIKKEPMFNLFSDEDLEFLTKTNSTIHLHHLGSDPTVYQKYETLNNFLEIVATGRDIKNQTFIAIVKGKNYPIYGFQFHSEKVKYDRSIREWANPSINHIRLNDNFGLFFIDECRKNPHKIDFNDEDKNNVLNTLETLPTNTEENVFLFHYFKHYSK